MERLSNEKIKQIILDNIDGLVVDFTYYDRKDDEDLPIQRLNEAVKNGIITVDEMAEEFKRLLENVFNDQK